MPALGLLPSAERLYADGRYRECLSIVNAGLRDDPEAPPVLWDIKARCHDALGEPAAAEEARRAREAVVDRYRARREAHAEEAVDRRERDFEAAMHAVGARRVGETGTPRATGEAKESASGWVVVAAKIGLKGVPMAAKLLPLALKGGLVALSIGAYSLLFTWQFAVALVIMVSWHEMGHVLAMRKNGIATSGFYLIPFMGGVAIAKNRPQSHRIWAEVVLAGPAAGALLSAIGAVAWYVTRNDFIGLVTIVNTFINLVNLLPIYPLDGGQLVKILSGTTNRKAAYWFAGASAALSVGALLMGFWLFALLGLFSVPSLVREAKLRERVANGELVGWELAPSDMGDRGRAVTAAAYLGLAGALLGLIVVLERYGGLAGISGWL